MRSFFKFIYKSTLAVFRFIGNLYLACVVFGRVIRYCRWSIDFRKTKWAYRGDCLIFGNGPDLKKEYAQIPKKMLTAKKLCVNNLAMSDLYEKIKPDIYLLIDPSYWKKDVGREWRGWRKKLLDELETKTTWPLILLLPNVTEIRSYDGFTKLIKRNKMISLCYFNHTRVDDMPFRSLRQFLYRQNLGMICTENVLLPAIFLMINTGFKRIFLFGANHSWHKDISLDKSGNISLRLSHFYQKDKIHRLQNTTPVCDTYHHIPKLSLVFAQLSRVFAAHEKVAAWARHKKTKVFNATSGSYIDAYQKVKIKDL